MIPNEAVLKAIEGGYRPPPAIVTDWQFHAFQTGFWYGLGKALDWEEDGYWILVREHRTFQDGKEGMVNGVLDLDRSPADYRTRFFRCAMSQNAKDLTKQFWAEVLK